MTLVVGGHSARSWNKTTKDTAASCSTWYYIPVNHTQCVCGNKLNSALVCSEKQNRVYLNIDYCMTEMESGELVVGFCRNGYQQNFSLIHNRIYTLLPENPDDLDETQCQQYNRKGLFCGECIEGYGPSVYSLKYSFACSNCSKMSPLAATALYLTLDLVPVTLLFFLIMTFRINLTKGPLLGYILFCQLHIQTVQNRLSIQSSILSNMGKSAKVFYHMALFLSSIWNLDFFKASYIVPPFCISDKITDLTALCFEYLLMVYTIVLVLLTYMCIEYYSRTPWFCVCLCKPLYILCIRIRQKWSSNESIIHAYATLLFLLFIRINSALYSFNESTPLTTTNSTEAIARVLIFSPQTKCYTREHIPYILLSISIIIFHIWILSSLVPLPLSHPSLPESCNTLLQLQKANCIEGVCRDISRLLQRWTQWNQRLPDDSYNYHVCGHDFGTGGSLQKGDLHSKQLYQPDRCHCKHMFCRHCVIRTTMQVQANESFTELSFSSSQFALV